MLSLSHPPVRGQQVILPDNTFIYRIYRHVGSFGGGCDSLLILSGLLLFARYPRRARSAIEHGFLRCIPRFSSRGGSPSVRASVLLSVAGYALTGVPLPRASGVSVALWGCFRHPPVRYQCFSIPALVSLKLCTGG